MRVALQTIFIRSRSSGKSEKKIASEDRQSKILSKTKHSMRLQLDELLGRANKIELFGYESNGVEFYWIFNAKFPNWPKTNHSKCFGECVCVLSLFSWH